MKSHRRFLIVIAIACLMVIASTALGAIPRMISYQGKATDVSGNPVPDGDYQVRFYIYDHPTAGNMLWYEMLFTVHTTNGLFSYLLGSHNPIPDSVFAKYDSLYLAVMFNLELQTPRTPLVSTGYAFRVNSVDGAAGGTITGKLTINGAGTYWIDPDATGLNSVYFPTDGINAREIYDEPGIAQAVIVYSPLLSLSASGTLTEIVSVDITTPAAGYILVEAQADVIISASSVSYIQIDETLTSDYSHISRAIVGCGATLSMTTNLHRYYYKSAGTYTFHLGGHTNDAGAGHIHHAQLSATYFPTAYGSVQTTVSSTEAGQFQSATAVGHDGQTSYKVDLRELELKAAKAEAEAEKAKADLLRAKLNEADKQTDAVHNANGE
jgi:hypothetical protein